MTRFLAMCLLFWAAATVQAAESSAVASQGDLNALKELQQTKWEAQKELQIKDIEAVRQQISAVDKRVDDQLAQLGQSVDRFGILMTVLGVGITVLLVLGGFLGFRNAKSEAKEAATDAAKNSAQEWFEKQATSLKEQIESLERKAAQAHLQMDQSAQDVLAHADVSNQTIRDALRTAQESMGKTDIKTSSELNESTKVLAQRDQELKNTNEDSYSFDDWNTRAHAAYSAGKLDDAAHFWLKAAGVSNAGAANVARVLINRGVTQGQLNQSEAAIATYDEVLRRFSEATEPALRESVAKALVNKGNTQGQLNQSETAIGTYDEVLRRFGEATEPVLRELVAKALFKKGVAQGQLNQSEAAVTTYDEVLRRFGEASEPALREPVAMALVNKGVAQDQLNQSEAAIATYEEVLRRFGEATEPALREPVATALVNKGITQGQLNQIEAAIATYDEVLRRFGEATEPALRELVAKAMNNAGFNRLLQAKAQLGAANPTGHGLLKTALDNLNDAVARCVQPDGSKLGNRAYVQCLLGQGGAAESDFGAALRAPVYGGQEIYEATLKDLDMNPLPEDEKMRELVERAWAAYQAIFIRSRG